MLGESWASGMWRVRMLESDSMCWEPQDVLGSHYFRVYGWKAEGLS